MRGHSRQCHEVGRAFVVQLFVSQNKLCKKIKKEKKKNEEVVGTCEKVARCPPNESGRRSCFRSPSRCSARWLPPASTAPRMRTPLTEPTRRRSTSTGTLAPSWSCPTGGPGPTAARPPPTRPASTIPTPSPGGITVVSEVSGMERNCVNVQVLYKQFRLHALVVRVRDS